MARADTRTIRFVRALLPEATAHLDARGVFVVNQADRVARLPGETVARLVSQGVLAGDTTSCRPTGETRAWLRRQLDHGESFANQHRTLVKSRDGSTRNLDESPLARLAAAGTDGSPAYLSAHQVEAGERVRKLVERAQLVARTTMSYDANRTVAAKSGSGASADLGLAAADARARLDQIARALPDDCCGVVFDVCGLLKGLQTVESERGWPRRSAKLVLRIGLEQLAQLFGLTAQASGPAARGTYAWQQQRPTRFE